MYCPQQQVQQGVSKYMLVTLYTTLQYTAALCAVRVAREGFFHHWWRHLPLSNQKQGQA